MTAIKTSMTNKNALKICRLLVSFMLFNMLAPLAYAGDNVESGSALICTSVGLVSVNFSSNNDAASASTAAENTQHCPFCKLSELPARLPDSHLAYPSPDVPLATLYQAVLPTHASQYIATFARLRAPPIFSLA